MGEWGVTASGVPELGESLEVGEQGRENGEDMEGAGRGAGRCRKLKVPEDFYPLLRGWNGDVWMVQWGVRGKSIPISSDVKNVIGRPFLELERGGLRRRWNVHGFYDGQLFGIVEFVG